MQKGNWGDDLQNQHPDYDLSDLPPKPIQPPPPIMPPNYSQPQSQGPLENTSTQTAQELMRLWGDYVKDFQEHQEKQDWQTFGRVPGFEDFMNYLARLEQECT